MNVLENISLSDIVYYRIGGKARYVLQIASASEVQEAIAFIRSKGIAGVRVLGLGSNVILPEEDFTGAVIWLRGNGVEFEQVNPTIIRVFAGETMDSLIQFTFQNELTGLEWAGGLPSTVGGAIRGNAGAFGSEIKDSVVGVEAIDLTDPLPSLKNYAYTDCQFAYRNSYFKQHPQLLIVNGLIQVRRASGDELITAKNTYQERINYRQTNHPMEYPSCGSVFKNITGSEEVATVKRIWPDISELSEKKWHNKISMGYVINRLGFSGVQVGGAQVSPKHTNYIVNVNNAKAEDVRSLITQIQQKFQQTFGFVPEPEVAIVNP